MPTRRWPSVSRPRLAVRLARSSLTRDGHGDRGWLGSSGDRRARAQRRPRTPSEPPRERAVRPAHGRGSRRGAARSSRRLPWTRARPRPGVRPRGRSASRPEVHGPLRASAHGARRRGRRLRRAARGDPARPSRPATGRSTGRVVRAITLVHGGVHGARHAEAAERAPREPARGAPRRRGGRPLAPVDRGRDAAPRCRDGGPVGAPEPFPAPDHPLDAPAAGLVRRVRGARARRRRARTSASIQPPHRDHGDALSLRVYRGPARSTSSFGVVEEVAAKTYQRGLGVALAGLARGARR